VTEAHIVAMALHVSGMDAVTDEPAHSATCDPVDHIMTLSRRLVDEVWLMPSPEQLQQVFDSESASTSDAWCICGEGKSFITYILQIVLHTAESLW